MRFYEYFVEIFCLEAQDYAKTIHLQVGSYV